MTAEHGRKMIKSGREVIERALKGPEMQAMHKAGHGDDAGMKYTHELGNAIMTVADLLDKMSMEGSMSEDMMAMHHMHIMINHALEMAAQGSNMVMLGQMGMSKDVDKYAIEHGKMMLSDARAVLTEVMTGKAMTGMHEKGVVTGGNPMMADTHKIGDAAKNVVDLLDKMAAAGPMKMK
jgi:plasmid stability protein